MRLYVVRHAQSRANADVRCRDIDCELTDAGRRQAEAVAADLAAVGLNQVLASPYLRTLETAREIARASGAAAAVLPDLHEHHAQAFPENAWPLMPKQVLGALYPEFELPDDMPELGWQAPTEQLDAIAGRMARVLAEMQRRSGRSPHAQIALVSHATPIQYLIRAVHGPAGASPPVVDNASVTIIEVTPETARVESVNQTGHLRAPVLV